MSSSVFESSSICLRFDEDTEFPFSLLFRYSLSMKKIMILISILLLLLGGCQKKEEDPVPSPDPPAEEKGEEKQEEKEEETVVYEGTTVIISCDDAFTEEDLNALLKKYDLQIKYTYSMMHGYALNASYKLNEKAAKKLIDDLLKEEGIVSAELDHETKIDDPVTYDK